MPQVPKKPLDSMFKTRPPGFMKGLTRWFSKPNTTRGKVSNLLRWRFRGQWKVGEDYMGNEYYLYQPFEETPIRRFCIFRHGQIGMDDIPFLWYQWIRYQRNYPPTTEEMDEYENYLIRTQQKAQQIKEREASLHETNREYYDEQKKKLEEQQKQLTNKAQKEVIELFSARESALRIAAENKVAKMQEAENLLQSERRRWEELQHKKSEEAFKDPTSTQPKEASPTDEQPFEPGAWRPWAEQTNENDSDNNTNKTV